MPKVKISEYSATANSNTDVASINIDEGCAPSGINNAIRAIMGHLKDFQSGTNGDPFNGPVNGTVGATTPSTGAFTTLSATGNVTLGDASTDTLNVGNGGLVKDASGNVGIGTSSPAYKLDVVTSSAGALNSRIYNSSSASNSYAQFQLQSDASSFYIFKQSSTNTSSAGAGSVNFYEASAYPMAFYTSATERMRIDSSGNLGLGVTPSAWDSTYKAIQVGARSMFFGIGSEANMANNAYYNSGYKYVAASAAGLYTIDTNVHKWYRSTSTPSIGASTAFDQAMTLDASGNLLMGVSTNSENSKLRVQSPNSTEWSDLTFLVNNSSGVKTFALYNGAAGFNAAQTVAQLAKNTSTSRSLNAAGTLNASGADYAEYMTKAGNFNIAKGDVVGINIQGKLTNVFADAVSFCVKSTDPSYVGGDVWGNEEALGLVQPKQPAQRQATEEVEAETDEEFAIRQSQYESDKATFEAALEAARQTVDRIAFAGQVPVNVLGATAGQYIIPVNDNGAIKGEAVNEADMTLAQYMKAVGKVIAIEQDGRAKIIVKVA